MDIRFIKGVNSSNKFRFLRGLNTSEKIKFLKTLSINPTTFPTDALAFWKLGDLTDSINGNTLTDYNNVQFVAGLVGDCAEFNESNKLEQNSLSSNFNPYGPAGEFTVSIWVYPYTLTSYQAYIGGDQGSTFIIHTDENGGMHCNEGESGDVYISSGLVTNQWQHIVFVKSLDGNSKVWLDGIQIYNDVTQNVENYNETSAIRIGAFDDDTYPCNAKIDMVGLWNRELNENEIAALYNNGAGLEP
jgi:hypothetical protein